MSRIKVDRITDKAGTGAPILVNGMNVTGKSTMGDIVGAAVTFNSITGGSANFSSDVSIGGTLTYEDVKNVDSVGLITARSGINITGGDLNAVSNLILKVDGTERVRTTTAGNFGINDNNPANQLVVKAPGGSGHCAAKVLSGDASTALFLQSIQGSEGRLGVESNHPLALYAGTAERLRIGTAGQLGINGANYGTSGQVLTSGGASAVVQWATPGGTETLISSTSMNAQNNFTLTGLDFTTYPRGYRFVANNFNIFNVSGNWTNGTSPRFRLGTSGGIMATNYGYQSIEQRSETQNIDQSSQNSQDEVRISTNAERWFVLDMTIYPADLSGSPANGSGTGNGGYPAQFSVKSKYLRPGGSNYNQLACMSLEGGMHLHGLSGSQIAQVDRIYFRAGGSNETFNGGTMRTYGLK